MEALPKGEREGDVGNARGWGKTGRSLTGPRALGKEMQSRLLWL